MSHEMTDHVNGNARVQHPAASSNAECNAGVISIDQFRLWQQLFENLEMRCFGGTEKFYNCPLPVANLNRQNVAGV
jgi:hypothetical protein